MSALDPDTLPELTIGFGRGDTEDRHCLALADNLWSKFTAPHPRLEGYGAYEQGASILVIRSYDEWWENVGQYTRRKVRRARKRGYQASEIDRNDHLADIFAINTSLEERQGRPMTDSYQKQIAPFGPLPDYSCARHRINTYGVLKDGVLVGYTWVYQVGEMCLFSTILGHGEHLSQGIMFLLIAEVVRALVETAGTRYAMYNMHSSGTEGLKFFKERMGFRAYRVHWVEGVGQPAPPTPDYCAACDTEHG